MLSSIEDYSYDLVIPIDTCVSIGNDYKTPIRWHEKWCDKMCQVRGPECDSFPISNTPWGPRAKLFDKDLSFWLVIFSSGQGAHRNLHQIINLSRPKGNDAAGRDAR